MSSSGKTATCRRTPNQDRTFLLASFGGRRINSYQSKVRSRFAAETGRQPFGKAHHEMPMGFFSRQAFSPLPSPELFPGPSQPWHTPTQRPQRFPSSALALAGPDALLLVAKR
jgi:hypothetical protein